MSKLKFQLRRYIYGLNHNMTFKQQEKVINAFPSLLTKALLKVNFWTIFPGWQCQAFQGLHFIRPKPKIRLNNNIVTLRKTLVTLLPIIKNRSLSYFLFACSHAKLATFNQNSCILSDTNSLTHICYRKWCMAKSQNILMDSPNIWWTIRILQYLARHVFLNLLQWPVNIEWYNFITTS